MSYEIINSDCLKAIRELGYEPVEDEWDDGEEEW